MCQWNRRRSQELTKEEESPPNVDIEFFLFFHPSEALICFHDSLPTNSGWSCKTRYRTMMWPRCLGQSSCRPSCDRSPAGKCGLQAPAHCLSRCNVWAWFPNSPVMDSLPASWGLLLEHSQTRPPWRSPKPHALAWNGLFLPYPRDPKHPAPGTE